MTDQKDPQNTPDPNSQTEPDPENEFFGKLEGVLDKWFDKKVESYRKGNPDQSRTGGRTSMPKLIADIFIGQR